MNLDFYYFSIIVKLKGRLPLFLPLLFPGRLVNLHFLRKMSLGPPSNSFPKERLRFELVRTSDARDVSEDVDKVKNVIDNYCI